MKEEARLAGTEGNFDASGPGGVPSDTCRSESRLPARDALARSRCRTGVSSYHLVESAQASALRPWNG